MDRDRLEEKALDVLKDKIGFDHLSVDWMGRVEIWFRLCDEDTCLFVRYGMHNYPITFVMPERISSVSDKKKEHLAWKAMLDTAKVGNDVFFLISSWNLQRRILLPKHANAESLLIENDLRGVS